MDDLLIYGVERLGGKLRENPNTNTAFKALAGIIEDFSKLLEEENLGTVRGLIREVFMLVPGPCYLT